LQQRCVFSARFCPFWGTQRVLNTCPRPLLGPDYLCALLLGIWFAPPVTGITVVLDTTVRSVSSDGIVCFVECLFFFLEAPCPSLCNCPLSYLSFPPFFCFFERFGLLPAESCHRGFNTLHSPPGFLHRVFTFSLSVIPVFVKPTPPFLLPFGDEVTLMALKGRTYFSPALFPGNATVVPQLSLGPAPFLPIFPGS